MEIEKSEKGGITTSQLSKLADQECIVQNLSWKPDQKTQKGRVFYPYLDIKFVKARLIEICGAGHVQFNIEKDQEGYAIGSMGIFVEGDWIWNSALGVERATTLKDKVKADKVKYKGNHADAYKSCAELFGLIVPKEIKSKILPEPEENIVYDITGKIKIGHIQYNLDSINDYLNGINQSLTLLAQIWLLNKKLQVDDNFKSLMSELKSML
jgi:hypothetical protein